MPRKINYEKKIDDIDKKIEQLKNQKNQAKQKLSVENRKKRIKNLIKTGEVFESLGIENLEVAEKFKEYYLNNNEFKNEFDNIIDNINSKEKKEIK